MTGKTILVVEDDALIAYDVAIVLREAGYAVMGPYRDADEALFDLERGSPDAALLDFELGLDQTAARVAHHLLAAGTPIAFLTGHPSLEPFADDLIARQPTLGKPFSPDEIVNAVSALILGAQAPTV